MQFFRYNDSYANIWNEFVRKSKNATFLFDRHYMDYHKQRFEDFSFLFFSNKGKLICLFPATYNKKNNEVISHGGLTYGGLLVTEEIKQVQVLEIFELLLFNYKKTGVRRIKIRPIPHIYHEIPSEEELYALFKCNAILTARGVSSTIDLKKTILLSSLRKRKYQKGCKTRLRWGEGKLTFFWEILTMRLQQVHGVKPTHSFEEISLLVHRFTDNIKCFCVENESGETLAGTILFITKKVVHTQYIATSSQGEKVGALDFLFVSLLKDLQKKYLLDDNAPQYFDFGLSTEFSGKKLNEGLIFQKEGFGARTTVYDEYTIELSTNYES